MDIFEDIIGYEGLYQINRLGQVKSIARGINRKNKILNQILLKIGYFVVTLSKNKKAIVKYIHRLMGIQFIPNPENKPTIDHIDRNPQNNSLENLRWATYKEQCENQERSAIVRGTTSEELKKKTSQKHIDWVSITRQFRRILRE
jgi:hypothetical protein